MGMLEKAMFYAEFQSKWKKMFINFHQFCLNFTGKDEVVHGRLYSIKQKPNSMLPWYKGGYFQWVNFYRQRLHNHSS